MKIDHIGIAVKSIDEAKNFYKALGLELRDIEIVKEQGVKVGFLKIGKSNIELLEPLNENSPVFKFIEKRGGGIHHIAIEVNNIEFALTMLKEKGFKLINEKPEIGAHGKLIAFVHPKSTGGVLLELCQIKK